MQIQYSLFSFPEDFFRVFVREGYSYSILETDARRKQQIQYLEKYLTEIKCKSILVEHSYVDHDFLDDFANYYVKCFTPYDRFCRRAHFWRIDITHEQITQAVIDNDEEAVELLQTAYLGFVVVKPLPDTVIGRTVLDTYPVESGKRVFPALREYKVNIFGFQLEINSLASQEQDSVLAACATTALWCSLQKTAYDFHTYIPTPSDITKYATRYIQTTRPIPSRGLNLEQMCYAISESGLTPELYQIYPNTPINSLIYSYVSAGLPVIIVYNFANTNDWHAVTVCGYRVEDDIVHTLEVTSAQLHLNLMGQRIPEFYVHDDNLGPFSRLECISGSSHLTSLPEYFARGRKNVYDLCIPQVVIVPLYHKIRLSFDKIRISVFNLDCYFKALGINDAGKPPRSVLEWDIRLIENTELKKNVRDHPGIDRKTKKEILYSNLARYYWISTAKYDREELFSVLSDATDTERSFYIDNWINYDPEIKSILRELIRTKDPELKIAEDVDLSIRFVGFLRSMFLE